MIRTKLKSIVAVIALSVASNASFADLNTPKAVLNTVNDRLVVSSSFVTPVSGDLYLATIVGGKLIFLINNGQQASYDAAPFATNQTYQEPRILFDMSTAGIPAGRYPFYQVVTKTGMSLFDQANWMGGVSLINFMVGLPVEVSGDFNQDGFADDDSSRNGFYDDDLNYDGYHDDDLDRDGYHDDDLNRDGYHDVVTSNGKDLYVVNCVACHGANPMQGINGIRLAVDPNQTRSAINRNKGGMGYLNFLTDSELQAIADYVKNPQ